MRRDRVDPVRQWPQIAKYKGFGVLILASCADTNQNTESVAAEPQAVENLNVIADDFQWQRDELDRRRRQLIEIGQPFDNHNVAA